MSIISTISPEILFEKAREQTAIYSYPKARHLEIFFWEKGY